MLDLSAPSRKADARVLYPPLRNSQCRNEPAIETRQTVSPASKRLGNFYRITERSGDICVRRRRDFISQPCSAKAGDNTRQTADRRRENSRRSNENLRLRASSAQFPALAAVRARKGDITRIQISFPFLSLFFFLFPSLFLFPFSSDRDEQLGVLSFIFNTWRILKARPGNGATFLFRAR